MKSMQGFFNRRLLAGLLAGLAGYLRAASAPDPKVRRQRYVLLFAPVLPEILVRLSMRFISEEEISGGSLSCLPFYLSPLAFVTYTLYLRPRIGPGRQLKNALTWRRLAAVLAAAGAYLRATSFPRTRTRSVWLMVASPIVGEVVEEVVERHNAKLAHRLGVATAVAFGLAMVVLGRRELREEG